MKKRLLSKLLCAALTLTLLPTSAFAAETGAPVSASPIGEAAVFAATRDASEGEITNVCFYADAELAKAAVRAELAKRPNLSKNADSIVDAMKIENNTIIIEYNLSDTNDSDSDYEFALQIGDGDLVPITTNESEHCKGTLCAYTLDSKDLEPGKYTVYLYDANSDDELTSDTAIGHCTSNLVETTIDFGVIANGKSANYIISDTSDVTTSGAANEKATIWADEDFFQGKMSSDERLQTLIQFNSQYEASYKNSTGGEWDYNYNNKKNTASFVWRYNLTQDSISAAALDEENFGSGLDAWSGTTNEYITPTPNSVNTIQLKVDGLKKHVSDVYGRADSINSTSGYWIGFEVTAPENCERVVCNYAGSSEELSLVNPKETTGDSVSFYVDANKNENRFFIVQFYGAKNVELTQPYRFEVETSNVTMDDTLKITTPTTATSTTTTVTVENDAIKDVFDAAKENGSKVVTIDASSVSTATNPAFVVKFTMETANYLAGLTSTDPGLKILVGDYGTVEIPSERFAKLFAKASKDGICLEIKPSNTALKTDWMSTAGLKDTSPEEWQIDTYTIKMYQATDPTSLISLPPNRSISLSLNLKKVPAPSADETNVSIWAVQFDEQRVDLPVIYDKNVVLTDNSAALKISQFGWYGVARRDFIDKMKTSDDQRKLSIYTDEARKTDITDKLTYEKDGTGFDADKLDYTLVTDASTLWIEAEESDAVFKLSTGDVTKSETGNIWEVPLSRVSNTLTIRMGYKTYTIDITRVHTDQDQLELEVVKTYDFNNVTQMAKIKISNAVVGRRYFVQITNYFPKTEATGTAFSLVERTEDQDAWFYIPVNTANRQVKITVFEISETATKDEVLDENGPICGYDPKKDENTDRAAVFEYGKRETTADGKTIITANPVTSSK